MPRTAPPSDLPTAVLASASQIRLDRESDESLSRKAKRVGYHLQWQADAWRWYDEIGEVWYSHTYVGNALGRLHWQIGWLDDDGEVVPARDEDGMPTVGVDPAGLEVAQGLLDDLVGDGGTSGEWARPLGTSLSCVAEAYLVGYHVDFDGEPVPGEIDGEPNDAAVRVLWESYSPTEIERTADKTVKVQRSKDGEATTLPGDVLLVRIWRRHPRWPDDPDGPMSALLDVCEDLQILSRSIRGSALSRTHAGLFLIANEALGQPLSQHAQAAASSANGTGGTHPVVSEIMAGLVTPHRDPGSASVLVPTMLTTRGEWIKDGWRHINLHRDIDPAVPEERKELLRRYAQGVDLPPEVILGMADLNHWTAWQIGEDAWRHVEPHAAVAASGLTMGYLRPGMRAEGTDVDDPEAEPRLAEAVISRFVITYDPSAVLVHPNRGEDADKAFDRGAISWPAYRKYKRFTEDDAPEDDELAQRKDLGLLRGGSTVGGDTATSGTGGTPAARSVVTASAADRELVALTDALAALEVQLLRDVLVAADMAVDEAVRKASASLRNRAGRDPVRAAQVRGVHYSAVAMTLGRAAVVEMARTMFDGEAETDEEAIEALFAAAVAGLLARYRDMVDAAHSAWRDLVFEVTGEALTDVELATMAADRVASEAVLDEGVRAVARARLFDAAAHSSVGGEIPAGVTIPPPVVRRAAARAGGVSVKGGVAPMAVYEGGAVTGPTSTDALGRRGIERDGVKWRYGSTATRQEPFEPHVALNDQQWVSYDAMTAATAGTMPWGSAFPGDHAGCQCVLAPTFRAR